MNIGQDILVKCLDCGFITSEQGLINGNCPNCNSDNIADAQGKITKEQQYKNALRAIIEAGRMNDNSRVQYMVEIARISLSK